ncbi:unnamed protein product [Allacma fusca]|uniref:Uncharacterized protein n=1 Tax=Allacma fusca TaxID=39272 RepID=A0A8J2KGH6_9HEXA|nr:unnamed protein product [Allacma fusca]
MNLRDILVFLLSFFCALANSSLMSAEMSRDSKVDSKYDYDPTLRLSESLIPANYNSLDPPPTDRVEFSVVLMNVRDIEEMKQEVTLEMNFRIYWEDTRLKNLTGGEDFIVINPESFEKRLWRPDVFIDHAKEVKQPVLLTKPVSMRLFSDGGIRYSARISVTLACQMNFKFYPADTQHCKVDLKSYAYPNTILTLGWHQGISTTVASDLRLSNYYLTVKNTGEFLTTSTSGIYSGIRFTVKLRRDMSYHVVQTYLPSSMFILVTFMTFVMPQDSGAVAIAMTTLLTMTAMFAAVRQNTPNVSYAKAIDIWMVVCMLFVFYALGQHMITMRLRHMKIELIQQDMEDAQKQPTFTTNESNDTPVNDDPNVLGVAYRGIHNKDSFPMQTINIPTDEQHRNDDVSRRYSKEPTYPPPPIPMEDSISAKIKEYKALGNKIRRISSILTPISFIFFNVIYWTWLLGSREY